MEIFWHLDSKLPLQKISLFKCAISILLNKK